MNYQKRKVKRTNPCRIIYAGTATALMSLFGNHEEEITQDSLAGMAPVPSLLQK